MLISNTLILAVVLLSVVVGFNPLAIVGGMLIVFLNSILTGLGSKMGEDLWLKIKGWNN